MSVTKLRGNTQIKDGSIDSVGIHDYTILPVDVAPNSFTGAMFIDGSVSVAKLDTNFQLSLNAGLNVTPYVDFQGVTMAIGPTSGYGRLYFGLDKRLHLINDLGEDSSLGGMGATGSTGAAGATGSQGPTGAGFTSLNASDIANDSGVTGASVMDALNSLNNTLQYDSEYKAYEINQTI